ncbi:hypothetical protein M427DRAFT_34922 [Gonapodya prolifera JEL478]|uniref:Rad21/Rec8-like protein N-terminal domain-containing protein n=1 Tax=Gonapodya prolifera (strain JEL478) TaxID=1344416 RepID=A0A139A696_GONPJ|nr:hypothetical protein M427DRAFT_34922 [Gonapodya prolifera JEL478]|eukprot:KXS12179.1 hypothetical protein M427DRAFT_34922 [Gonapodya prolifera JEL478]
MSFLSKDVLTRKAGKGIGVVWIAAHVGTKSSMKRLSKKEVQGVDVVECCNYIVKPPEPLALRMSSNLMVGVARVLLQQYMFHQTDLATFHLRLKAATAEAISGKPDVDMKDPKVREDVITLRLGHEIEWEGGLVVGAHAANLGWLRAPQGTHLSQSIPTTLPTSVSAPQSAGSQPSLSQASVDIGMGRNRADVFGLGEPGFPGRLEGAAGRRDATSTGVGSARRSSSLLTLPADADLVPDGADPYAYDPAADPLNDLFAGAGGEVDLFGELDEVQKEHGGGRGRWGRKRARAGVGEGGGEGEEGVEGDERMVGEGDLDLFSPLDLLIPRTHPSSSASAAASAAKSLPTPPPESPPADKPAHAPARKRARHKKPSVMDDKTQMGHADLFAAKDAAAEWVGDEAGWSGWGKAKHEADKKAAVEVLRAAHWSFIPPPEIATLWETHVLVPRKDALEALTAEHTVATARSRKNSAAKKKGGKQEDAERGPDAPADAHHEGDVVPALDDGIEFGRDVFMGADGSMDVDVEMARGRKQEGSSIGLSPAVWRRDGSSEGGVGMSAVKGGTPWSGTAGGEGGWEWGGGKSSVSGSRKSMMGGVGYSPLFKDGDGGTAEELLPFDETDIELADIARESIKFYNFVQQVLRQARTDVTYFFDLLGPKPTRGDKANKFTAMLSLATRSMIGVKQEEAFGDIQIRLKKGA